MSRKWTKEDVEYLTEKWGNVSIPSIAKKLNRSVNAVKIKAGRLNLGPMLENGAYVTLNQLAIALTGKNLSPYCKKSWIENRGMPVEQIQALLGHENIETTKVYLPVGRLQLVLSALYGPA